LIDSRSTGYIPRLETPIFNKLQMNLFSLLKPETILSELEVSNKQELISVLVDSLSDKIGAEHLQEIKEAVWEREQVMSTGVGKGLAIPHCKTELVDENHGAFAVLKEPLEFNSVDDTPVRLVFLLVGPNEKNSIHIKLLSRISRLMNSGTFREQVFSCESSQQILEAFQEEEEKYFPG
jgi:fructose-specific phosphotransferase system IIA component